MLSDFSSVVAITGGMAALGAFIDFLMYESDRKKLRDWLTDRWFRLSDTRWAGLTPVEAEDVVAVFDELVGEKLLSSRRWWASWFIVLVSWMLASFASFLVAFAFRLKFQIPSDLYLGVPIDIVMIALSLSATRWIALKTVRYARPGLVSVFVLVLVVVGYFLFMIAWSPIIAALKLHVAAFLQAIFYFLAGGDLEPLADEIEKLWSTTGFIPFWEQFQLALSKPLLWWVFSHYQYPPLAICLQDCLGAYFGGAYQMTVALLTNAPRILLSVVFLAFFVLFPILPNVLLRLLESIIESDRPIAAVVCGGFGFLVAFVSQVIRWFS